MKLIIAACAKNENHSLIFWGDSNVFFCLSSIFDFSKVWHVPHFNQDALFAVQKAVKKADCSNEQPCLSVINSLIGRVKSEFVQT
jgi:hypothetical protein